MDINLLYTLKGITTEEYEFVQQTMSGMNERESRQFIALYSGRRRDCDEILLLTLLGFAGVSGVHRLMTGRIFLGIIYFLTGGLFLIGTVIDAFKYKSITTKYNQKMALKCAGMVYS